MTIESIAMNPSAERRRKMRNTFIADMIAFAALVIALTGAIALS